MMNLMIRPNRSSFAREIDRFFDDFFVAPTLRSDVETDFVPRVNIKDTKDHVSLTFEIPGMNKEDIKVTVKDNLLTVSGQREWKTEEKDEQFVRSEIRTGSFTRSFTLPENVNEEKISADYRNGLLDIRLEKVEAAKPKEIEVKVS
jgi:HSP20 family protein